MSGQYKKLHWTEHAKLKMRQYGLSKMKLLNLLRKPDRKEQGIAEGTMALMQSNKSFSKTKKPNGEIWLMYADNKDFRKIISAWRYPGISKPGDQIPVPKDILEHIMHERN
jgi:hypothetical protein